jgi:glycine/D-amino acid oxidase-like deaminating enzyme
MHLSPLHQSLWSTLAQAATPHPPLAEDIDTDVLVCGGGILGLSTALHLAEKGMDVTLVEAEESGFGASGRNTGFVVPSLKTAIGPEDVATRLGPTHAEQLVSLVGQSGNVVFDLIRRLSLDCSAEQTGWLQPAHSAQMLTTLERRAREWQRRGSPIEMLGREATAARIGTGVYHGALFVPSGGQINPLAYTRELARACVAAGVKLFERTPVSGFERIADRWHVRTPKAVIRPKRVLLATNALVGNLLPEVNASIIPARVFQIATQCYDADVQARILPTRTPVADTRRHTFAARWSPDGRLVTGGLVIIGPNPLGRAKRKFSRRLRAFFPSIPAPEADYAWTGVIAVTLDSYPRFLSVAPDMDAVIGCNGRGVALTTALGRELASYYAGETAGEFVLPVEKPKPVPMRRFTELAPSLWLPWSEFRDARESVPPSQAGNGR